MFTRRGFLRSSSAAASVALCRPVVADINTEVSVRSPDKVEQAFLQLRQQYADENNPRQFLGYPSNRNPAPKGMLEWCEALKNVGIGQLNRNNVGDPFHGDPPYSSHYLERDLVNRFGLRYGFPADNIWGIVSHSGTDSNMHGAYVGRTLLKQRTGQEPKIYYTQEAHYSIQVIRDLLGLEEVLVRTNDDASMDIEDLEQHLARDPDTPVLLIATIGTTFKGGIDDIDRIQEKLKNRESYLHLDAALFGGYLQASTYADLIQNDRGGKRRYNSLAVSLHKFFGFHSVAGLFICCRDDFENYKEHFSLVHDPAYISHVPGTITCSRNPVHPAQAHYYCTEESLLQQQRDTKMILENAAYLQDQLHRHFPELESRHTSKVSNTVYFRNLVSPELRKKWTLATIRGKGDDTHGLAHIVIMPHATKPLLDQFLQDFKEDRG